MDNADYQRMKLEEQRANIAILKDKARNLAAQARDLPW